MSSNLYTFTAVLLVLAAPGWAAAAEDAVTAYPATFFAPSQPTSAFDMLQRLPGFAFDPGDADVRGFAGASGNVLIDGKRPTSKQESLEAVLRRIPAGAVERIELIRAGASGVDMQGRTLVANVVRRTEAAVRGRADAGLRAFPGDRLAPRIALEGSGRRNGRLLEASLSAERRIDDEKGAGPRDRVDPDGRPLRAARYRENQWTDQAEASLGLEGELAGGKLRLDASARVERTRANILETATFPAASVEVVGEREDVAEAEIGAHYDRALAERWTFEGLGLGHWTRTRARDQSDEGGDREVARVALDARETIARGLVRREGGRVTLEAGAEAALNTLESHNGLARNGVDAALPSSEVGVVERRGEGFATLTWRATGRLTMETGARFEISRLTQRGDVRSAKALSYLKPRVLAALRPSAHDELRLEVERRVGQLDFEDFVSSASLTSNTVTAGNPDLEPERAWRTAATWERRFAADGSIVVTLRHDEIDGVVDRVPVIGPGFVFDAPGNLGHGSRDEVQVTAALPFDGLGVPGLRLKADGLWRWSRVKDPATAASRRISGEPAFEGTLQLSHDLPAWRLRWGADVALATSDLTYLFDEVKRDRIDTRLSLFVEYRPAPAWTLRLHADNLMNGRVERTRAQYGGLRGQQPLRRIESRSLEFGPSAGVTVQRTFGG